MQALLRRARDLEVISDTRYTSLFQMLSRYGYRKDEPVKIQPEEPMLVRDLLKVYKESGFKNKDLAELTTTHIEEFHATYYPEMKLAG